MLKGSFYAKTYAVIVFGMAIGMTNFPSDFLLYYIGGIFFFQVFLIARLNDRFFIDSTTGFILCFTKLVFCVRSLGTLPHLRARPGRQPLRLEHRQEQLLHPTLPVRDPHPAEEVLSSTPVRALLPEDPQAQLLPGGDG